MATNFMEDENKITVITSVVVAHPQVSGWSYGLFVDYNKTKYVTGIYFHDPDCRLGSTREFNNFHRAYEHMIAEIKNLGIYPEDITFNIGISIDVEKS